MIRGNLIAPGEYYHLCNRGVNKQAIFHDNKDYQRFLFLLLYFQSDARFPQVSRSVKEFVKHPMLDNVDDIINKRTVELTAFCIMPNHFHLVVKEVEEGGITSYIQRISNAYAKYYNTKYNKSGHVLQGAYRLVHVNSDRQIMHLSAYVHRNPREISKWFKKEDQYPWSSYQDFIAKNRWSNLLMTDVVTDQFKSRDSYHEFVRTSPTKILEEELPHLESL